MINKKTVFIVGAGASFDLNFPLGKDLKESVAAFLSGNKRNGDFEYFKASLSILVGSENLNEALHQCNWHSKRIQSSVSIDNYLDQHRDDLLFVQGAKLAIGFTIARAENKCAIRNVQQVELLKTSEHYFLLDVLNLASRNHQANNLQESLNNFSFVTFNYDRCLERYIGYWLNYRFANSKVTFTNPEVVHVYGSLGPYPEVNPFDYQGEGFLLNPHLDLVPHISQLKTFTEQEDSEISKKIENLLEEAEVIYFVGFGFEEQNIRFFKKSTGKKTVFATTLGLGESNTREVIGILKARYDHVGPTGVNVKGLKARPFFEEFRLRISRAVQSVPEASKS